LLYTQRDGSNQIQTNYSVPFMTLEAGSTVFSRLCSDLAVDYLNTKILWSFFSHT